MINELTYLNAKWFWPIVIIALLLMVLFIWKDYSSTRKKNRVLKIIVAFLAVLSLSLMALKPATQVKIPASTAIILTDNVDAEKLDSLRSVYPNIKTITYDRNTPLFSQDDRPTSVYILGDGISSFDLWQVEGLVTNYLGEGDISGTIALNYSQKNIKGNHSEISGVYHNPPSGNYLVLEGPGGIGLDSVLLDQKDDQEFKLSTQHKAVGKFLYALAEKDSLGNIRTKDPLPFDIKDRDLLHILMINRFPMFETKYLKNYLAELGHHLVVRSQLTKGKYKYEYLNSNSSYTTRFSQKNLEGYDLLIIDAASLRSLMGGQLNALKAAINQDGLGVYIQADDRFFRSPISWSGFAFKSETSKAIRFTNWPRIPILKQRFQFKDNLLLEPMHQKDSTIYSAYRLSGKGKIGSSVLSNTYQLLLNGHTEVYQRIWTDIVSEISKSKEQFTKWSSENSIAYKDEPFTITLHTNIKTPTLRSSQNLQLPLKGNIDLPRLWNVKTYPKYLGWQSFVLEQDSSEAFNYFVTDSTKWQAMRRYNTILVNKRTLNDQIRSNDQNFKLQPINRIWFYSVFLLSVAYLWLEPKL